MNLAVEIEKNYFTEEQILSILKIKKTTLRDRIYNGTEHPPYMELGRGYRLFPKEMFIEWIRTRPITWEVKRAS